MDKDNKEEKETAGEESFAELFERSYRQTARLKSGQ